MSRRTPFATPAHRADLKRLSRHLDRVAGEHTFSGAIAVDLDGVLIHAHGYGQAERMLPLPNTADTRFNVGGVSTAFTALAVMSLIEDGTLSLRSRVRPMLGSDLPEIDPSVTLEQLLGHTSGIGDYREAPGGEVTDYVLPVPPHTLATTEGFLPVLSGRPMASAPGERFAYNHSGYLVLALAAERASGTAFHDLVQQRVLTPAGLVSTRYPRLDQLPRGTAIGYLRDDSVRTNVLHRPVRGNGDGGAYTTVMDLSRFWRAVWDGKIVSTAAVAEMLRPRHTADGGRLRYGLGFWLDRDGPGFVLEGHDAGLSVRTRFDPTTRTTVTIVSNSSEGAWPVVRRYEDWLEDDGGRRRTA